MNQSSSLTDAVLSADNGGVIRQIATSLGLPEETVSSAARSMLPAIAGGLERNLQQPGGDAALAQALSNSDHERYLRNPQLLDQPESIADGNKILGHVLGSKDVSRNVAGFSAGETGIPSALLKKMLPMLATAAMGILASKMTKSGTPGVVPGGPAGGSMMDMLGGLLDMNKNGSPVDDLLSLGKKYFQR